MSSQLARHLVVGCIGCALGWLAHATLHQRDEQTTASHRAEPAERVQPSQSAERDSSAISQSPTRHAGAQSGTSQSEHRSSDANTVAEKKSDTPDGAAFVLAPDRSSDVLSMPSSKRQGSTAPNAADRAPLAKLLNTMTIWCRFDPGNGAWLREQGISMYELAYQGGPISYESINIDAGTARMTGSQGATGSVEGTLDVLVTATRSGLHFSAFNSRGELVVTTVFGAVDKQQRHLAVMTTHGTHAFNGSFQTYGACDTGSPKARYVEE